MKKIILLFLISFTYSYAQISIWGGNSFTQDFSSMGTSATATLPTGWKVDKLATVRLLGTYSAAGTTTNYNAGNSMSTSASNGIYNFGLGVAGSATDRALGGISSGTASKSVNVYAYFQNTGNTTISNPAISYNVYKFRNGSNAAGFTMQMYYSTDGSTWTSAGANFTSSFAADADNNGGAVPLVTSSITNKTLTIDIAAGGNLYLAWDYSVTSGTTTTNAQALGLDNVVINCTPATPPTANAASLVNATGFTANWNTFSNVTHYYLDISTDIAFGSFLTAGGVTYNNLDMGTASSCTVTGLIAGQTYYYRVRAYFVDSYTSAASTSANSNITTITTVSIVLSGTEAGALNYSENDPATIITPATTLACLGLTNLAGGVVQVTGNYQNGQDVLSYTTANGISGSWDASTGKLTLSGSSAFANYQTAIQSVKYQNTSESPSTLTRTVSFSVNDGTTSGNTVTRNITVASVNDVSALGAIEGGALNYFTGNSTQITNTITISDLDNSTLQGASIQITGNYSSGNDILVFTNQNGITGSFSAATGTLTLSGISSLVNYQTALRSIKFQNLSSSASTLVRIISFTVNDGISPSNTVTRDISVDNAPVLASIESSALSFSTGGPQTQITGFITVADFDNVNLAGAVIRINGYYESGKDILSFTNADGIAGSWDSVNGILTLSGVSSVANYQTALRNIKYQNISASPVKLLRTISFTVNDGFANSTSVSRNIDLGYVQLTLDSIEPDPLVYKTGEGEKIITSSTVIDNPSWPTINSASIQITKNYVNGEDILNLPSTDQIISVWNATEGKLELTGSASLSVFQAALRSVTYKNVNASPNIAQRTISFVVGDGYNRSYVVSRFINISILKNINLNVNIANVGSVSGGGSLFTGFTASILAAPKPGYTFVNWTEGGVIVSTAPGYSFTVSTDRNITANFVVNQYILSTVTSPVEGGTTTGAGSYNYGTSVTVVATPLNSYNFVSWTNNGVVVSTSPSYTFNLTENQDLVANFIWPAVLSISAEVINVGPGSGSAAINVTNSGGGTFNWTAASDIFWLKINSGASGTNNGTINISYTHNNSISRVGTITITADGVAGSPKRVEIRQNEIVLGVENIGLGIPTTFKLDQNYPNPFNPTTIIRFGLPKESKVVIRVFNIMGEEIAKLVDGQYSAGTYEVNFDAGKLSSGLYMYMISAGDFVQVKKMLLTK